MLEIFFYVIIGFIALAIIVPICREIPWNKFNIRIHWFHIAFSLMAGVLGFIIMNDGIGGKIGGGVLFAVLGWPVAMLLNFIIRLLIKNKVIIAIICIIICILLGYFAFTREYGRYHDEIAEYIEKYEKDIFNKDPNTWTKKEKDFVDKYYKDAWNR